MKRTSTAETITQVISNSPLSTSAVTSSWAPANAGSASDTANAIRAARLSLLVI